MTTRPYKIRRKPSRRSDGREYPFYPNHILRVFMAIMGAVAVVATIAALFPLPLDHIADPLDQTVPGSGALWILKPVILLGDLTVKPVLTSTLIFLLAVLFVLLPILDRSGQRSLKRRVLVAVPFLLWMLFLALSLISSAGVGG